MNTRSNTWGGVRYGDLKAELAEAIDKDLAPTREKEKNWKPNRNT